MPKRNAPTVRIGLFLTAALMAGGVGCATLLTPGDPISSHSKGTIGEPDRAPSDGEYVLVPKFGDTTPMKTISLNKGDPLGFKTGRTGEIVAVAGGDEWTYPDGDYVWIRRKR